MGFSDAMSQIRPQLPISYLPRPTHFVMKFGIFSNSGISNRTALDYVFTMFVHEFLETLLSAADDDDTATFSHETGGGGFADATCGSFYEDSFVGERHSQRAFGYTNFAKKGI